MQELPRFTLTMSSGVPAATIVYDVNFSFYSCICAPYLVSNCHDQVMAQLDKP